MNLWTKTRELLKIELSGPYEILTWGNIQVKVARRRGMRSLVLRMESAGQARLTCPYRASLDAIENFLEDRTEWMQNQNSRLMKWEPWKERCGREGETYLYLGDELQLKDAVTVLKKPFIAIAPAEAPLLYYYWPESMLALRHQARSRVFAEIGNHFEKKAEEVLAERAHVISELMALKPKQIRFRSQRSRWGSCSSRGHISLNRRLIGAPLWVIDSVIIHEFAHLVHLNHSPRFWELVKKYCADHEKADQWLSENQFKLLPG